ncbi:uncharacterized protein B0T23DRAFT_118055 [Neurospora hispaniola]|uniref:Uncharacterized protein n=1 Tax=Neurospora hispaniola TaxID=588809 RepID=A0AAJ0IA92_9PEZI|nr:hypothetical protein B0T23DRAFT_118055 [Neurospora hispaniola]
MRYNVPSYLPATLPAGQIGHPPWSAVLPAPFSHYTGKTGTLYRTKQTGPRRDESKDTRRPGRPGDEPDLPRSPPTQSSPFSRRPIPSKPSVRSHLLSKQLCDQVEALRQPGSPSLPSPFSSIATIHALGTSGRAFSSPATPRLRFQCAGPPTRWLRSAWPRKWASRNRNRNRNRQDWSRQDRNKRIKDHTARQGSIAASRPVKPCVRCISTSVQLHGSHIHCQPLSGRSSASTTALQAASRRRQTSFLQL